MIEYIGIGVSVLGTGLLALNLLWTHNISQKTRKIESLEVDLRKATSDLIDQKLGLVNQRVGAIESRLLIGDTNFKNHDAEIKQLQIADRDLKLEIVKAINDLRDKVATSQDLNRLREELRRERD